MYIESITMTNFRCFGNKTQVLLQRDLTALIGSNGTGKTALCMALQRVFGVSADERAVRKDDFHISAADTGKDDSASRHLLVDIVLALPELDVDESDKSAVPEFFTRISAHANGSLKCRIVLESTLTPDGTSEGAIETQTWAVSTLDEIYTTEQRSVLPPSIRSRVQFVYVPASRDGVKQVTNFLRGRLWRAAHWSSEFQESLKSAATTLSNSLGSEGAIRAVESAFAIRWGELHRAGTHATAKFRPFETELSKFLRGAELAFEPDHASAARPVRLLSDGQRSLVHLAMCTASLDLERSLHERNGSDPEFFNIDLANLPSLTVLAVEEPENNLAPYFLSRIVRQLTELGTTDRVQVLLSSHSAASLNRVEPTNVRHFWIDNLSGSASVRSITLPPEATEEGKFVREAVRAHPELYFAKFVILGEGDSEQVVIPSIAEAMGLDLDPSFIAMVPLGGRHTQHFWRLLNDLNIPHATLLDMDHGRAGGGGQRIREVCNRLKLFGKDPLVGLKDFGRPELILDDHETSALAPVLDRLRSAGVFFAAPLDLDMLMTRAYPSAYQVLSEGQRGPEFSDALNTVLGTGGGETGRGYWEGRNEAEREVFSAELRWYRYLFTNRSKPATHLAALARITKLELNNPPEELRLLIEYVNARIETI